MKTAQKGFIVPLLIVIIAVLAIGGGFYIHSRNKKTAEQAQLNSNVSLDENGESVLPLKDFNASSSVNASASSAQNNSNSSGINTSANVTLDLSNAYNQQYKTTLAEAFNKPASFDEHYVVADISCGAGCFSYAVIDKNTGKVYPMPVSNDFGQFAGNIGQSYGLHSNQIKVIVQNGSKVNTYSFNGSSFALISSSSLSTDILPTQLGQCATTKVAKIGNRLVDSGTGANIANSGSSINYTNGGFQVSYYQVSGIDNSHVGDDVRLCLIAIPRDCPAGDSRGKVYKGTNLRTNETWQEADSSHACGGA